MISETGLIGFMSLIGALQIFILGLVVNNRAILKNGLQEDQKELNEKVDNLENKIS